MKRKKPPSVTGMPSADRSANLGKYLHPAKTKKVAGRAPTQLKKTATKRAPLVKAGGHVARVAREMGQRNSMKITKGKI